MQPSFINIFLSDAAARAVCWTLVHSLWEGVLAALFAGLIILCTRKLPATLRYNLLVADLLLFVLMAGATFFYEIGQTSHAAPTGPMAPGNSLSSTVPGTGPASIPASVPASVPSSVPGSVSASGPASMSASVPASNHWVRRANDYLNIHATLVTLIWLICLSGQVLRLMSGLYQVRRLRQNGIPPASEYWEERLMTLAGRLGIKRQVQLLQSRSVKMPSVLGFIKPYILLPLGMLSNLSPDQVETILLHELAHIRRGDYLTNLLLHFTEAIFFFNPGIRWIGALIRREREACCDDMVLGGTPDRNNYFHALIAFTQWSIDGKTSGGPSFALQLGKSRTDLLWRIKRMLDKENKKLQIMEKAILSFGLLALVSASLISMKAKDNRFTPAPATSELTSGATISRTAKSDATSPATTDTRFAPGTTASGLVNITSAAGPATTSTSPAISPAGPNVPVATSPAMGSAFVLVRPALATPGHTHIGTISAPSVTDLSKANLRIEAGSSRHTLQQVTADTVPSTRKEVTATGQIKKGNWAYMQCKSGTENGKKAFHMEAKDDKGNVYLFENTQGEESEFRMNGRLIPKEEYHLYPDFLDQVAQLQGFPSPGVPAPAPAPAPVPNVSVSYVTPVTASARITTPHVSARTATVTTEATARQEDVLAQPRIAVSAEPVESLEPAAVAVDVYINPSIGRIVDDLVDDKIISQTDPLSFHLDKNELTVNDSKQSKEVYAKYSAKYLKHPDDYFTYTKKGGNSHVDVHTGD